VFNITQRFIRTLALTALFSIPLLPLQRALALPVSLGAAGPGNWALLEISFDGTSEVDAENLSGAAAPPFGFIHGNVGGASITHISTSAGNFPIVGTVYLGTGSTADSATAGNATGGVVSNQALTHQAALDARAASTAAAGLASSGGGIGFTSITAGMTLTPGVYNLTNLNLPNGAVLNLTAGGYYVFNISGTLALHSAQILTGVGLSESEVLFNITGTTGVAFSGGLNQESVLHGIILAPDATVSITPGLVVGEVISGENVNIASGGSIQGVTSVPDAGSTVMLMGLGLSFLAGAKRKFHS
jgi:hypothetical protein